VNVVTNDSLGSRESSLPTIPEGLDLIPQADGVIIRKVWLRWWIAGLALFAVVWDAFLFFWYSQVARAPNTPWIAIVFPIGHVAVGVGVTYYVLAALVNKTDVMVSSAGVRVEIGPAPWMGNKVVKADEITDVLVRERSGYNRNQRRFNVMYADRMRRERKLVTGFTESDQADFVAQVLRLSLKLPVEKAKR
jgi:hypothetical protein